MTFSTRNFDPISPKFPNFSIQILLFCLKHTVAVVTHAHVMCYKVITPLGHAVLLAKNNVYVQDWRGAWLGEHPKIWDPLRISATVEASN